MNRIIKFRGKRVDNGNWIYGSLINNVFYKANDNEPCCYIIPDTGFEWGESWEDYACQMEDFEVSTETVGQNTGLNDKKGTPIYEGDILKSPFFEDMNVAVIWNTKHAQFTFGGAEFNVEAKPEDIEVLGNIYENKDLLNK